MQYRKEMSRTLRSMKDEVCRDTNTLLHNITHEQAPSSQVWWGKSLASQIGVPTNLAKNTEHVLRSDSQELHTEKLILQHSKLAANVWDNLNYGHFSN